MPRRLYANPHHQPFTFAAGPVQALLIPGFLGTPAEMRPLGLALAEAGVSAHGVLLPGFGPDVERLGRVRRADWLRAATETWQSVRERAERTVLVGFSMGGAVALQLAAELPPDRLILLAPHWRIADRRAVVLPLFKYMIRQFRPYTNVDFADPEVRLMFAELDPTLDLDDPAIQSRLRREVAIPTATLDELRRFGGSAARAARRVGTTTLVVQGHGDDISLPHLTRRLIGHLRGQVTLREIAGDHYLVRDDRPSWADVRGPVIEFAAGAGKG